MTTTTRNEGTRSPHRDEGTPMKRTQGTEGRITVVLAAAALVAAAAACNAGAPTRAAPPAPAAATPRAPAHGTALTSGASCPGTDVHQKHINLFACVTCHPTGATWGFDVPYAFPGGTTTAGGTITLKTATTPTTCTVACHYPKGAPTRSVTWDTPGPLACTACHAGETFPAGHPAVTADEPRSDCETCHLTGAHMDGAVALVGHAASWTDQTSTGFHAYSANRGLAACQPCHAQDLSGGAVKVGCGSCHDATQPNGTVLAWSTRCTMCHGGTNDQTGAPPKATWGNGADAVRIGAHGTHVSGSVLAPPFDCGVCHPKPADAFSAGHIDAPTATVTFAGVAIFGVATQPAWDRTAATCSSTYCHGATLGGGSLKTPVWTTLDGTQAACGTCHGVPPPAPHPLVSTALSGCSSCHPLTVDATGAVIPPSAGGKHMDGLVEASGHPASWMDQTSAGFHAYDADRAIAGCTSCHGADLSGGTAGRSCASCHDGVQANLWGSCTMCHGGTDSQTGAPPRTTWGRSADLVRVGAHTAHLAGSPGAPAFPCASCHVVPMDALSAGHLDSDVATVTFGGLATAAGAVPAWDRTAGTCSSTYCHGATLAAGGTNTSPLWTGTGQAACGTCHGVPPPAPHPASAITGCASCHPQTMDATGALIPPALGGKHVDGIVEAAGGGHAASWMDQTSTGFHAYSANSNIQSCTPCHGATLAGGSGPACSSCHNGTIANLWNSCTMCHGGTDNQTGAPPRATWGNTAVIAVGAHTKHVSATAVKVAYGCAECHVTPADALSAGHVDGSPTVTWGARAQTGGAVPSFSAASGTCAATYCHGNYSGTFTYSVYDWGADAYYDVTVAYAGKAASPSWTGTALGCDACHGNPPAGTGTWHSGLHGGSLNYNACSYCHPDAATSGGVNVITNPAMHVNGTVEVAPQWGGNCYNCH